MAGCVLVAPDKFKGTYTAPQVAAAIARGFRHMGHEAVELPVADGGDGTARLVMEARGGMWVTRTVEDPLRRPVQAGFALLDGGRTAVLDVANASGLWRLSADELDVWAASSRGTGQLIAAAASAGATTIVVAAGGSATLDAGDGALEVLAACDRLPRLVVACDVRTSWDAAATVFGPQKGASPDDVLLLSRKLDAIAATAPRDPRGVAGTGAAGGLSGALWAWFDAELVSGAAYVLDAIGFDDALEAASSVVTGEGRLDTQTLSGKAVAEVARRALHAGCPCDAIVGCNVLSGAEQQELALRTIIEAVDEPGMEHAGRQLAAKAETTV